jgi:hypothetical protein
LSKNPRLSAWGFCFRLFKPNSLEEKNKWSIPTGAISILAPGNSFVASTNLGHWGRFGLKKI